MPIRSLEVKNFTVFREAKFEFASGINLFIGENGTGKSHLLKLLYAVERAGWEGRSNEPESTVSAALFRTLAGTFRPRKLTDLNRKGTRNQFEVGVDWGTAGRIEFRLISRSVMAVPHASYTGKTSPVFIPPRELLSVFPGFAQTIRQRELEFDDTYLELADALALPELKGVALVRATSLLGRVESAMGGVEIQSGGRFYVEQNGHPIEAHMVAEGIRKVATIARLIRNGRIAKGVSLFWDEPESNMNPVLLRKVAAVIIALAQAGVQVFIASHDYLLTQTLSLAAEHPKKGMPSMRFFGLTQSKKGVLVDGDDTIEGIADNPILREHARQYDLEIAAFKGKDWLKGLSSD